MPLRSSPLHEAAERYALFSRTKMLKEKIYYVDEEILKRIESEFELIEKKDWYKLYENKNDKSFWRLDEWDKYQVQIFVKIDSLENWAEFDDKDLRIELLKEFRGLSNEKCKWKDCSRNALNNLVFCEQHAYTEMEIRK
jgi:hypothetical protein